MEVNKENKIKSFIVTRVKDLIKLIIKIYMIMCNKICGVDDEKIVFISFNGKSYSDNPRAISEKLHEIAPNFEIIWLFKNPQEKKSIVPDYVTCLKVNSISAYKALATSKFWIDNFCKPIYIYKSNNQVYIQTWHGDRGFKKILYDAYPDKKRPQPVLESNICDLVVSGSVFGEMVYKSAFMYDGDILKKGCPRNDLLIEKNINKRNEIRKILNIQKEKKIVLYAPTFRKESINRKAKQKIKDINLNDVLSELEKVTGKEWLCLIRAHNSVVGLDLDSILDNNRFIDVSNYEDANEILLISDLLITDYSSIAGDFALLGRPIVLFHSDIDDYLHNDRTFYFDINKSPFIIARNQFELINFIKGINDFDAPQNCKEILEFYGAYETGQASHEIVQYILNKNKL